VIIRFPLMRNVLSARCLRVCTGCIVDESCFLCMLYCWTFGLTLEASGSPGAAYCVTGESIVHDMLGDGSACTTKSTPIWSVVFCRGTVLCGKFSKSGEGERVREREREFCGFSKAAFVYAVCFADGSYRVVISVLVFFLDGGGRDDERLAV